MRLPAALVALIASSLTSGCFVVHRIDVEQGNFVTQDLVDKVKTGMTKSEVKQVLGTPLLNDAFHANRWDYYFSNKPGRKPEERAHVTIVFQDDKVVSIKGEGRPAGSTPTQTPSETRAAPPTR